MWVAGVTGMALALSSDPAELFEPPIMLGGYRVLDRIAEGGLASIFRGHDLEGGGIVALKTVRTALGHEIASLSREIALLRGLRHPDVVRFIAAGTWNGVPWMALELLEGKTLFEEIRSMWRGVWQEPQAAHPRRPVAWEATARCRSGNASAAGAWALEEPRMTGASWIHRLEVDPAFMGPVRSAAAGRSADAVSLITRLAQVLDNIHRQGIVHRDLKPENVMLGHDGRMTLLDFGLASRLGNQSVEVDEDPLYMGTVEYAAPEQLCGGPVDTRADIYSLGCILYELITGRFPFDGLSANEIVRKHLDDDPVAPSDLVSEVPWQLEDLILDMLAKHPEDRPRRAGDVVSRLKQVTRRRH